MMKYFQQSESLDAPIRSMVFAQVKISKKKTILAAQPQFAVQFVPKLHRSFP